MAQEACLKIIRNLHNMKEEKRKSFFSYWSCCCYSAFITYLRKHYKRTNEQRQYLLDTLQAASDMGVAHIRPDIIKNLQYNIALYDHTEDNANDQSN